MKKLFNEHFLSKVFSKGSRLLMLCNQTHLPQKHNFEFFSIIKILSSIMFALPWYERELISVPLNQDLTCFFDWRRSL